MTTEEWFIKFAELKKDDTINFDGLRLKVWAIMSSGGCQFTKHHGGEVVPRQSPLWDSATIEGKSVHWVDSTHEDEEKEDSADWWKE